MAASRDAQDDASYQVVARRFRPQTFQELVGQDEVLTSLRAALQQGRVPHAFLFSGSRGVGKTTSARILARCLNCVKGPTPEPCGACPQCLSILDGSNPDVMEIDAASNNAVDDVRRLRESVGFATMTSRYRVVILDEAHMMSKSAFNAFLKTLEEPPPRVVFVLATTELHKVPETIRSRCQVLLFRRVGEQDLQKRLRTIADREQVTIPDEVLAEIASAVRGGVRDAETALERVLPLARELGAKFDLAAYRTLVARVGIDATIGVCERLLAGDAKAGLHFARDLQQHGTDEREALGEIVEVLRWLLLLKVDGTDSGLVPLSGALRERLVTLAAGADGRRLDAMIAAGLLGRERLRRLEDRGVVFEVALVRMAEAGALPSLADLLAEVRAGGGLAPAAAAGKAPSGTAPAAGGAARPTFGAGRPGSSAGGSGAPAAARSAAAAPAAAPRAMATDLRGRVLAAVQDRQLLLGTLELCRFDGPNDKGVVVLTLQSDRKMYRDRLASPVVQQEVTKAVQDVVGPHASIEWRFPDVTVGADGTTAPPPKIEPGPVTKRVMGSFRGRVVQVNPEDRVKAESKPERAEDDGAPVDEQPPDPVE
ncbi:MAG: DNA polymerase III subunit gamma/tau [Planctomycetes bacterium]|nr:DNA polymerase III subunit gamma/tau [Planctomycetota bacterium]